jgi:FMN reductase
LLRAVLARSERYGSTIEVFGGADLLMAPYAPGSQVPSAARALIEAVRTADAVVLASPGYHGAVSGLVKNALDYLEELRVDNRPYLSDRPVGIAVTAFGWQAAVNTLGALRQIVHALRGWPTPLGLALNVAAGPCVDEDGKISDPALLERIDDMASQLTAFKVRDLGGVADRQGTVAPLPPPISRARRTSKLEEADG